MEQVKPGVWFIEGENRGRFPFANSLYINSGPGILIDTGAGNVLKKLVGRVEKVLLSHYHRDHLLMNRLFEDASFLIHELDAPGVETVEGLNRLSGMDCSPGSDYWKMVDQPGFEATVVDERFSHGSKFDLGSTTLKVLHTPGHTPGHCSFLLEEYNLVFASDIDLTSFGPWYGNRSSDPEQFRQSIKYLRSLKPEIILTSHREPVTRKIDQALLDYERILDRREEKIVRILRKKPLSLEQLVDYNLIFRRHPYPRSVFRSFEGNMLRKHLDSMIKRGEICRDEGDGVYWAV